MKLAGVWKSLGSGVYESLNKTRIHTLGLIKLKGDKRGAYLNTRQFSNEYYQCLRICGCNHKRAMMLLAELMERGEV